MKPYDFTHLELAHSFNKEPNSHHWFPTPNTVSQTRTILNMLWGRGNVYVDAPPEVRVVATAVAEGRRFTIVGMPKPQQPGESYFAAFVGKGSDGSPGGYFVWDRSVDRGKANMAEYRGPTMRISMGTYDDPGLDGFATQLADVFKLSGLDLVKAPAPPPSATGFASSSSSASNRSSPRKRSGCMTFFLVMFVLQVFFAIGVIIFWEVKADDKAPGTMISSHGLTEGEDFTLKLQPPAFGVSRDTVWVEVFGGDFKDAQFKVKGWLKCKRGKKKYKKKSFAISFDDPKKFVTRYEMDVEGKYRLATYTSKAKGKPLICKGNIKASPGHITSANVLGTRQQRPSDFVGGLFK